MPKPSPHSDQPELPLFDEPEQKAASESEPVITTATPPATGQTRVFAGWNRPVLESAVAHLLGDKQEDRILDLSDHLVIVPTRHAGRRLREKLALEAASQNAAVVPPLVTTQDFLVSPERLPSTEPVADRHATRLIWAALLLDINLNRYRRIFPIDPVDRNLTWAMKTAGEFLEVRNLLAESGLTFRTASAPLEERDMEPARWQDLSELEEVVIRRTEDLGFRDETLARIEASKTGVLPPEIQRVLVAGTPDLNPVSIQALSRHSKEIEVTLLLHAPEEEAHRFDHWGRPLAEAWLKAEIEIPNADRQIRATATPASQAELACDLVGNLADPAPFVAMGVPDPEIISPLEQAAASRKWSTYDPGGRPVSRHGIYYLLDQTAGVLSTQSFDAVARLLRCPDFGKALATALKKDQSENKEHSIGLHGFLIKVDELREKCLPDRLDDAISAAKRNFSRSPELALGLEWIAQWLSRFRNEDFGETLAAYLSEIFAERRFSPQESTHGAFSEVADSLLEAEKAFEVTQAAFGNRIAPPERFHLLLELIRERHLYEEREPQDIDLQGWLELLWEDAPHLIVTGMNDHVVPESIIGHAFLPDSARRVLGIPNNDDRFARDAYLLTAVIQSRRDSGEQSSAGRPNAGRPSAGRVDLLFGRQSESGDPLRPSRLLFQCPDAELPQRTLQFFGGEAPSQRPLSWELPWKLEPQSLPDDCRVFTRLSVTQIKNYLTCPFRFYLQNGLGMDEVDPEKSEMDARDFGNLVHDSLERFGKDPEASVSTDPREITKSFEQEIDAILYQRYGSQLSTPILIQREAARRRLAWWAEIEAEERAAGWKILEPETSISTEEHPFSLAGLPISGRIDRIEQHEDGRLRVFDFKTHAIYDSAKYRNKTVREFHITHIKRTEEPENFPEWARLEDEKGKQNRWIDLQIPLYILALTERYPDHEILAGHVALGPTQAEIVLDLWEDLDADLLASARTCAEGVIESVQKRIFWPPAERLPWSDPFEELLFGEAEESVDATGLDPTGLGG